MVPAGPNSETTRLRALLPPPARTPSGRLLPVADVPVLKVSSVKSRSRLSQATIDAIGSAMGYQFSDPIHLDEALTHSSAKTGSYPSNERMEFFGDAVLGMLVTEMLFRQFPEYPEGELTRLKSILVSRESLADKAIDLGFANHLLIGKGVGSRDNMPRSIMSNAFEALIAALYLDGGLEPVRRFVTRCFEREMMGLIGQMTARNYKSALQQLSQAYLSTTPSYRVTQESGPDHDKRFSVVAEINGQEYGAGSGTSKKDAEQTAARLALRLLLSELDLGDDDAALLMELPLDDDDDDDYEDD